VTTIASGHFTWAASFEDVSMKLLVVNPNTTASMTEKIGACARRFAAPGTQVIARNPRTGPASIEGYYDEAISTPGLLAEMRRGEAEGVDATVVACFDDPAIGACRELASGPVIGICEAAMHAASMVASSFSVVTTLPRSVPIVEDLVFRYGMERRCRRVRAADISVLALEEPGGAARHRICSEIKRAIAEDRCEAVILGCAGMAELTEWLARETGVPVIDGVVAGVKLAEALVGAGLRTSKLGAYAMPRPKHVA
jgi:allantoin racemase